MSKLEDLKTVLSLLKDDANTNTNHEFCEEFMGKHVIIRTYSAGVWFGVLNQKSKDEVILKDARRMWYWHAAKSISLSGVAVYGINQSESKICAPVSSVWLQAIEILPLTDVAIKSIREAQNVEAE